jgi:Flp pilus assembly protein TadG
MEKTSFKKQTGAVLIEMAIMLPIFTVIMLGALDFSRLFFAAIELGNAVTAGVQYGARATSMANNTSGISSTVANDAANLTGVSATSTSYCTCPGSSTAVGCTSTCAGGYGNPKLYVSVTGTYTYSTLVDWPGIPHTVSLTRTAIMRAR